MIFEDSRNAIYCDPNAYIQKCNKKEIREPKKVVFSEPYESLPAFYIDNNFKKGNCDCVPKHKKDLTHNHIAEQVNGYDNFDHCKHDDNCNHDGGSKKSGIGFNFKSLLPLLGLLNKGGGADLSQIVGLLNNNSQKDNNSNPMTMISNLLSSGGFGNILNIFQDGKKSKSAKKELKTTDFEIKNYTRV